jgi:secreted PhoX family phosphatase
LDATAAGTAELRGIFTVSLQEFQKQAAALIAHEELPAAIAGEARSHKTSTLHEALPSGFEQLIAPGLTRRRFLSGFGGVVGAAALGSFIGMAPLQRLHGSTRSSLLGFIQVTASTADVFVVPRGYSARPLVSRGDSLFADAPDFDASGRQDSAAQALQFGDCTDGMSLFTIDENRAVLAVNNEFVDIKNFYPHGGSAITDDDVLKSQYAHGLSIFEIRRGDDGFWSVDRTSSLNRRIHMRTPIEFSGPAAGHPLLSTRADPDGRVAMGTLGNCANGKTPWGTYLTCEENFQDYFATSAEVQFNATQQRYGLKQRDVGGDWYHHDERFDMAKHPHEPNRFGWVVEVNPLDPQDTPRKRTALGRLAHENAAIVVAEDGRVVVYMGDDARGEHIYRFVSEGRFNPNDPAANRDLLDTGTLSVARFDAVPGELQGQGHWIALVHGQNGLTRENGFADQAEILINLRVAASIVGGTTMDRPEWIVVHPHNNSVFCTLTNNYNRGVLENQPVDAANPRAENHYGHIVRWTAAQGDHLAEQFDWDLFLIAGNPAVHPGTDYAGSAAINEDNMFNSPDGMSFDADGRLWIQTDGDYSNKGDFAGMGNNQMLCADPITGEVRRFATGPNGCELTGITFATDYRTLFVGVQHPGAADTESHFPAGGDSKPRSTIMMIRRDDGGVIGAA